MKLYKQEEISISKSGNKKLAIAYLDSCFCFVLSELLKGSFVLQIYANTKTENHKH